MDLTSVLPWLVARAELNPMVVAAIGGGFVVGAFLPFPRTLLLIGAGTMLGMPALIVAVPCTTLGSLLAFATARHLVRARFIKALIKYPILQTMSRAIDAEGWRVVAIMRLGVPVPSSLQNYLFALTAIGLRPFVLCTFVFSIPQAALFIHLGAAGRSTLSLGQHSVVDQLSWALGIVTTIALIYLLGRHARRKLCLLSERQ